MLVAGRTKELIEAIYQAKPYSPMVSRAHPIVWISCFKKAKSAIQNIRMNFLTTSQKV